MRKIRFLSVSLIALMSVQALAATKQAPVPAPLPKGPSMYLRCDGRPNNVTSGETAVRLLAITALVGLLAPQNESADLSKRLTGDEGVAVCTEVLFGASPEGDAVRRTELIFARAIHQIEAGHWQEAIADARLAATDQPTYAATRGYKLSQSLTAIELEAMAHAGAGQLKEMTAKAIELAIAAPYDLQNMFRVQRYIRLTGQFGPAEAGFYEQLLRLNPESSFARADAKLFNGDLKGAAEDLDSWAEFIRNFSNDRPQYAMALAAVAQELVGNSPRAKVLADKATFINNLQAQEDRGGDNSVVAKANQALAFLEVVRTMNAGKLADARALLAKDVQWLHIHTGTMMEVVRRLRIGAKPAELTGILANTPDELKAKELKNRLDAFNSGGEKGKDRYNVIRSRISDKDLARFGVNTWVTSPSKYLGAASAPDIRPRYITVQRDGSGVEASYALLLHTALVAKAEGKKYFMMMPGQEWLNASMVRIGNEGAPGLIVATSFDADKVIADLGPLIPKVVKK